MLTITELLHPISAEQPCGADLSFSSELDAISRARQHDDPTLDQGAWVRALKEADWPFVAARCGELIVTTSKDLRLAVWLAEAQAKTRQLRGLGDGYALLAGLCTEFWHGLYPLPDDGDYEQRIGNLFWLLSRSPQLIAEMPLTQGAEGTYSLRDVAAARQRVLRQGGDGVPEENQGPDLALLETARRGNTRAFDAALRADVHFCLQALQQLETAVDARLGSSGPGFSVAREALQEVLHFIGPAPHDEVMLISDPAHGATVAGAASGTLSSRQQALAQLRQIAEFFRHTEPHSPVAYLADKAASWGELPLHLWLRAVVKDASAMAVLDELLGTPPGPGATS